MQFIRQLFRTDCAVAAFGMLTNITWAKAVKKLFPKRRKGMHYAATVELIAECFLKAKFDIRIYTSPTFKIQALKNNALIVIRENKSLFHAVAWDAKNKLIFDPGFKAPVSLTTKIRRNGRSYNAEKYYNRRLFSAIEIKKAK